MNTKLFHKIKPFLFFFICSLLLELLVFNCRALLSLSATGQRPEMVQNGNTFYVMGMSGQPGYLYLDLSSYGENGEQSPVTVKISLTDEGNSSLYYLTEMTIYPPVEKSKYLRIHSYGDVTAMGLVLEGNVNAHIQLEDLIYDAKVPLFFSLPRMAMVFGLLSLAWSLRPSSGIYAFQWKIWQKRLAILLLLTANSIFLLFLVRSNPAFLNPVWPYHEQYHQLAVSFTQGRADIDAGNEEIALALASMDNPYDSAQREQAVPDYSRVWDICYYEGNFYVYFGVVPVLLFYLPWYLLFQSAFPTWLGVYLTIVCILCGVYYLLHQICRKWFAGTPYAVYLLLSFIMSNGLNLYSAILRADFYYLPILMALCFSLWGLGLIVSALRCREHGEGRVCLRLALGALCLALTAGCRPQFLVGSFLLIPLLWGLLTNLLTGAPRRNLFPRAGLHSASAMCTNNFSEGSTKKTWWQLLALALPYLLVAAGLMYYNYIRFGSVFDFGANYNLTTNDMTKRGLNPGLLPDGLFMYLLQPVSFMLRFPFAEVTPFYSDYLGTTIRDWTYGGALWTHAILLALPGAVLVKKELQRKKLYGFVLLSTCMALIVVAADTQMAGILNRYRTDFLWLLMLPAMIILLQIFEKYRNTNLCKYLLLFILVTGAWTVFYELAVSFRGSGLINDNAHRYYLIKSLFQ